MVGELRAAMRERPSAIQRVTFAGENSKTADKDKLGRAKVMEQLGYPRDVIWKNEGWYRGEDDNWRYEIPDNEAEIKQDLSNLSPTFLGHVLKHKKLEDAYPMIMSQYVFPMREDDPMASSAAAYYHPGGKRFVLNRQLSPDYMLRHEPQHSVDDFEGRLPMTPTNAKTEFFDNPGYTYLTNLTEVDARNTARRWNMTPEQRRDLPPWYTIDVPEGDIWSQRDNDAFEPTLINREMLDREQRERERRAARANHYGR